MLDSLTTCFYSCLFIAFSLFVHDVGAVELVECGCTGNYMDPDV